MKDDKWFVLYFCFISRFGWIFQASWSPPILQLSCNNDSHFGYEQKFLFRKTQFPRHNAQTAARFSSLYLCTPREEGRQISGILRKRKSICNGAQYVTLDSKIKCLSLAVFILATPPIKLKLTGTAYTWETTNSKPPDQKFSEETEVEEEGALWKTKCPPWSWMKKYALQSCLQTHWKICGRSFQIVIHS